jgi:hypothetical protein
MVKIGQTNIIKYLIMKVNLAYYRKQDWKKFLSIIVDSDSMFDTWEEWHESFLKTKKELSGMGFEVNEVEVNLLKLDKYCRKNGFKNNGESRSRFVSNNN